MLAFCNRTLFCMDNTLFELSVHTIFNLSKSFCRLLAPSLNDVIASHTAKLNRSRPIKILGSGLNVLSNLLIKLVMISV